MATLTHLTTTLFLLATFLVLCVSANRPVYITSSSACLTSHDCPSGTFCDNDTDFSRTATHLCTPFVPLGGKCYRNKLQCTSGNYCGADSQFASDSEYTCRPRLPLGSTCNSIDACIGYPNASCPRNFNSRFANRTCVAQPFIPGLGGSCDTFELGRQCAAGLYCESGSNKCRKQRYGGGNCPFGGDDHCISGSCVDVSFRFLDGNDNVQFKQVCAPPKRDGKLCNENKQCLGYASGNSVCNIPRRATGKCMQIETLLKTPGAKCKPGNDRCDARRGLSCRWGGKARQFVCAHRAIDSDVGIATKYCTSNVKDATLSSCRPQKGVPTECRSGKLFAECQPKTEVIQQGKVCSSGDLNAVCAPGLRCFPSDAVASIRGNNDDVAYCAKTVDEGMECDRFGTQCAGFLKCVNGRCIDAPNPGTSLAEAYAQLDAEYNGMFLSCRFGRPCAPGLVCNDQGECDKPFVAVKKGANCFSTAASKKKCEVGTVCNVNFKGFGFKRCHMPFGVDGTCRDDIHCKGELKCTVLSNFGDAGTCYNPKLATLKVGKACDPKAGPTKSRCDVNAQCLKKKNKGTYVCQSSASVGEACDDGKNVACTDGSSCSRFNVCA